MEFITTPELFINTDEISEGVIPELLKLLKVADTQYLKKLNDLGLRPLLRRNELMISLETPMVGNNAYTYALHIGIYGSLVNKLVEKEFDEEEFPRVFDMIHIHFKYDDDHWSTERDTSGIISIDLDDVVSSTIIKDDGRVFQLSIDYRSASIDQYTNSSLFVRDGAYWPTTLLKHLR